MQVAKLAELPNEVVARAQEILKLLHVHEKQLAQQIGGAEEIPHEMLKLRKKYEDLKKLYDQLKKESKVMPALPLDTIDFDNLSPKKAFDVLWRLKERVY